MNSIFKFDIGEVIVRNGQPEEIAKILSRYIAVHGNIAYCVQFIPSGYKMHLFETNINKSYTLDEKATILFGGGQKKGGGLI